jgi:protein-ribulosamine 3-kinase
MLQGEAESAKEIYRLMPGLIPKPYGFGRYKVEAPITYFYLSEFVDMDITTAPEPLELGAKLSELHKKSKSPTGQFGFHVVTCDGKMPHTVDWQDSWATFYGRLLQGICKLDIETNGHWYKMERATKQLVEKVIPRLLGNLRHEGEPIKPCIIHGDLWEPNLGISMDTGDLVMYDVGSYYAHNEMDLGQWRADFCSHLRSKVYVRAYLRHYPAAEPVDEFDDRNRLYSLKGTINYSAGHPGCIVRQSYVTLPCPSAETLPELTDSL